MAHLVWMIIGLCLACLLALCRSYRRASLRDVEARQQLAMDTQRHENQKLLAEILTASSSIVLVASSAVCSRPSRRT